MSKPGFRLRTFGDEVSEQCEPHGVAAEHVISARSHALQIEANTG